MSLRVRHSRGDICDATAGGCLLGARFQLLPRHTLAGHDTRPRTPASNDPCTGNGCPVQDSRPRDCDGQLFRVPLDRPGIGFAERRHCAQRAGSALRGLPRSGKRAPRCRDAKQDRGVQATDPQPQASNGAEVERILWDVSPLPDADQTVVLTDPWNVRHQPPYLGMSQCFQKSGGALSCLTCHDPHERHRRDDPAYYRQKCVGCHNGGTHPPKAVCQEQRPSDCVGCHMPRVAVPRRSGKESHLRFSNHWIGVYGGDTKLQPSK